MYGLIKADDPNAASEKLIAESAFAEMDDVSWMSLFNFVKHERGGYSSKPSITWPLSIIDDTQFQNIIAS